MFRTVPLSINTFSSILILLASCQQNLYDIHHCRVYSEKLLLMDRGSQFHPDPASKLSAKPVWHTPLLCVQWKTPVDGKRKSVPSWSCSQAVSKTCATYTIAVCAVKNSCWWTEEVSSILILLASCQQNLYDIHHCSVCSEKLLMMDRGTVRNM